MNGRNCTKKKITFFSLKIRKHTVENDEKLCFFVSQHWTILWPETIDFFRSLSWLFPRKRGKKIAICQKKSPIYLLTTTVVKVAFPFLLSWHVDIKIKVPHNGKKWPNSKSVITIFASKTSQVKWQYKTKWDLFEAFLNTLGGMEAYGTYNEKSNSLLSLLLCFS